MRSHRSLTSALSALAVLLLLFAAGCTTTKAQATAPTPSAAGHTKLVEQDPKIRITTAEVMDLFAKEFGDAPLIEETLKKNQTFLLVDTRPAVRFQEGTVPGSINIPTPRFAEEIPKLPRDRMIIFYCGGLA